MNFEEIVKERYSVRSFKPDAVPQDKLDKILEAARLAPTGVNAQPQKIYVLRSPEALQKLDEVCIMRFNAPTVLMVCCDTDKVWKNRIEPGYDLSEMDSSIVCTFMMLEAWNLGLGSCWVRYFNSKAVHDAFNLPPNIKTVCLLPIGYKTDDCKPHPEKHFSSVSIEEMAEYL